MTAATAAKPATKKPAQPTTKSPKVLGIPVLGAIPLAKERDPRDLLREDDEKQRTAAQTFPKDPGVTTAKTDAPPLVADYISTLPAEEQRLAGKTYRHLAGQRSTAPSLRGVTKERAAAIREQVAGLIR